MFQEFRDLTLEIVQDRFEACADFLDVEKELSSDYNFQLRSLVSPQINTMLLTPENDYLIVGSCNFKISVWSFPECRFACLLEGHSDAVVSLCLHIESKVLYSSSADRTLRAWNYLKSGSSYLLYTGTDTISKIEVIYSLNSLICCSVSGNIIVFCLQSMGIQVVIKAHGDWISCFLVLEQENRVFTGSQDGFLKVWNLNTEEINQISNSSGVTCLEPSINKKTVAFGSYDSTISIICTENGDLIKQLQISKGGIIAIKYLNESQIAITSMQGCIKIWDWPGETELKSWTISPGRVNQFLTKGNEYLYGLCNNGEVISINLANLEENFKTKVLLPGFEQGLLSKNGEFIVGYQRDEIALFNLITQKSEVFKGHTKILTTYKVLPKYDYLITGSEDNTVKIWKIGEKVQKGTLKKHNKTIEKIYVSEPANKIITQSLDHICIWALDTFSLNLSIPKLRSYKDYLNLSIDQTLLIFFTSNTPEDIKVIDLKSTPTQNIIPNTIENIDSMSINRHKKYLCVSSDSFIFVLKIINN